MAGQAEDPAVEVHVTAPDAATAERLARMLVDERLAACVQVVPGIRSFYRWEDEVAVDDEHLLLVKTLTGGAQPIAVALDWEEWPEIVGTLAGDDAILVILRDAENLEPVRRRIQDLARA